MKRRRKAQAGVLDQPGQSKSVLFTPASIPEVDPANDATFEMDRSRELDPLSHDELSEIYGVGFSILRRMGYSGAGLKPGSLQAPLAARANVGRQGLAEAQPESSGPGASTGQEELQEPAVDLTNLLSQTLRSMREAGDDDEANELQHLATFCNLQGERETLETMLPRSASKRKRRPTEKTGPVEKARLDHDEASALRCLLGCFQNSNFPVEWQEQARFLKWNKNWAPSVGSFEAFVARHKPELHAVACPGGLSLLLPRKEQEESTEECLQRKCIDFCQQQAHAAGRGKCQGRRKWQHLLKTLQRIFKGRRPSGKVPPAEASQRCDPKSAAGSLELENLDEPSDAACHPKQHVRIC